MATFVLIPGAGGDPFFWSRVEPELRARGHDTLAVELPAGDHAAGFGEYADVVVAAIGDRTDLAVVAQSLGGFTGPTVCARVPVELLVLLNAMVPQPGETGGEWWANVGFEAARREQAERDGRSLQGDEAWHDSFFHDVPDDVQAELMAAGEPDQSEAVFASVWPLDAWPDVPTRVLLGVDDRFFPVEMQRRVAQERLGITPDEMPGGHLVALSRPAELADRLVAYWETRRG